MINGIGGAIGLYLGYSALSILSLFQCFIKPGDNLANRNILNVMSMTFKIIVFFICTVLLLLETFDFICKHPVTSSIKIKELTLSKQPIITICPLPPGSAYNFSNHNSLKFIIYCKNADYNYGEIKNLMKCFEFETTCIMNSISIKIYGVDEIVNTEFVALLSIHLPSEPGFVSSTIPVKKQKFVYIEVNHAQYIVDERNPDLSYDNCFQQCLIKHCNFSTRHDHINQCNIIFKNTSGTYPYYLATDFMDIETTSKIMNASKWFHDLKELSEVSEWIDKYDEIKEMCIKSCSSRSGNPNFLDISEFSEIEFDDSYFHIIFHIANYHSIEIDDWLSFSQLCISAGWLAGCW